jgi:hypothetical protein
MDDPWANLEEILRRQDSVLTTAQAIATIGRSAVRWRVSSGRWQRQGRGVLVAHSGPLSSGQLTWAGLLGCGPDAVLAGLAAAQLDGFRVPSQIRPGPVDVLLPSTRKRLGGAVTVRRSQFLGEADVHHSRLPRRTRLARSVVDAASWARCDDDARSLVASGLQQRLVRSGDILAVARRLHVFPRRRLIVATAHDASEGSHALGELDALAMCRTYGLPLPARQARRPGARGIVRWLDLHFEEYGLVVEIDGLWHMEVTAWWADLRRLNEHTLDGESLLRFPAFAVRDDPAEVARIIGAALRRRGWDPMSIEAVMATPSHMNL